MKFDNAFLTEGGNVGMQFKEKEEVFTVYRDNSFKLVVSEHATPSQKTVLLNLFLKSENRYKPRQAI